MTRRICSSSHSLSAVASLSLYFLPRTRGSLPIQNRLARKVLEIRGFWLAKVINSPRLLKNSSVTVMPTLSPAFTVLFLSRGAQYSTVLTRVVLPSG